MEALRAVSSIDYGGVNVAGANDIAERVRSLRLEAVEKWLTKPRTEM